MNDISIYHTDSLVTLWTHSLVIVSAHFTLRSELSIYIYIYIIVSSSEER